MSKGKVRLYQLARELNVESKDLIDLLRAAGSDVKNHMTTIDAPTRQLAMDLVSGKVKPGKVPAPEAPPKPTVTPEPIPSPRGKRLVEIPRVKGAVQPAGAAEVETALPEAEQQTSAPTAEPIVEPAAESAAEPPTDVPAAPVTEMVAQTETDAVADSVVEPVTDLPAETELPEAAELESESELPAEELAAPAIAESAAETVGESVEQPEPVISEEPPAVAVAQDSEKEKQATSDEEKRAPSVAAEKPLGPIPAPSRAKPTTLDTPSTPGGQRARAPGGDRRPGRPRPIIAMPPPAALRPSSKAADKKKKKPEIAAQKPVMKLPPEAMRGGKLTLPDAAQMALGDQSDDAAGSAADEDPGKKKKRGSGAMAGREERQRRRGQRAAARREMNVEDGEDEEGGGRRRRSFRSRGRASAASGPAVASGPVVLEAPITVRSFSEASGIRANQLQRQLMGMGVMAKINDALTEEQAEELALEFSIEVSFKREQDAESWLEEIFRPQSEDEGKLQPRPPVVTFMGHVDHGKTSLMDRIRKTNVVAGEAGGITQDIGAYQVQTEAGVGSVTFLDTPGHEAFTGMRARGATVTDLVVLVVAADDGVMPQTEEAISHAKAADVPIIVAMNKVDLPSADTERLKQQLSQFELIPEEWGGDTLMIPTSATTGDGLAELLDAMTLVAELREFKADPDSSATGTCIEASLNEGRGVQSSLLVRTGTLRRGDILLCGTAFGRVRAMFNDRNQPIEEAGPSTPVVVSGLDEVPEAGEQFYVLEDLAKARDIAQDRKTKLRAESQSTPRHVSLETLFETVQEKKLRELPLILKADVRGSLEAIRKEIADLQHEEVRVRIIHDGVGGIAESDVLLADASDAIIIGFRVVPDDRAQSLATEKGVEVRRYEIIYQVTDDIKKALEGMLEPELKEVQLGRAVVQETFSISRVGTIAGCRVVQGTVERGANIRIIRDGTIIGTYPIDTLRRFKDDAKEVRENMECGIRISGFNDVKRNDVLEAFRIEKIKRTI